MNTLVCFSRLAGAGTALIALSGLLACSPPEIEIQEQRIAGGSFSGLNAIVTDQGIVATALKDADADGGELTIVSVGRKSSCSLGKAIRYAVSRPLIGAMPGVDGRRLLAFGGKGTAPDTEWLRLADLDCRILQPELLDAPAPLVTWWIAREEGSLLFVNTAADKAFALDPSTGGLAVLSEGASSVSVGLEWLWFIEQGELVARDFEGNELRRLGSGATRATFMPDGGIAFADASGVWTLADLTASPVLVEAGACEPSALWGSPLRLGYLSPCADRRLVIADLDGGNRTELLPGVSYFLSRVEQVLFITGSTSSPHTGDLWTAPQAGGEARFVASGVDLFKVRSIGPDSVLVLADDDGTKGRLGAFDPAGGFVEWLPEVAEFDVQNLHVAALGDYDGQTGTLYVREHMKPSPQPIAKGVPKGAFAFSTLVDAVGYVRDAKDGAGQLQVRVLQTGQTVTVDEGVTEFVEVRSLETPGVLYAVGSGPRAGIYFGAAQ